MSDNASKNTTGHVWDDDLAELTNPLPNWWLWTFYITIIFSVVYWLLYPAWPLGKSFTKGYPGANEVTYVNNKGESKTTHWNMRAQLMKDTNVAVAAQKKYFEKVAATPFDAVSKDAELMQFVQSSGRQLFLDNCAACHQAGGQGKLALAPNLVDDSWIFGGTYEKIQESITIGRHGIMPPKGGSQINDAQIAQVSNYVLSLSGEAHDAEAAKAGDAIFHGEGMCLACHGAEGQGNPDMGSANLTDKIWLWADVPGAKTAEEKVKLVSGVVVNGLDRGKMPAWGTRLSGEQIKLLTVYVHDTLGGGK